MLPGGDEMLLHVLCSVLSGRSTIFDSFGLQTRGVPSAFRVMIEYVTKNAIIDVVYFCMERVLLYWSVVQYNKVQEKDRTARKGAMLPDGYIAMLPNGYITSMLLLSKTHLEFFLFFTSRFFTPTLWLNFDTFFNQRRCKTNFLIVPPLTSFLY